MQAGYRCPSTTYVVSRINSVHFLRAQPVAVSMPGSGLYCVRLSLTHFVHRFSREIVLHSLQGRALKDTNGHSMSWFHVRGAVGREVLGLYAPILVFMLVVMGDME